MDLSPAAAVARLSELTGETFELVGPMNGGETGATEIRHGSGTAFVLKWDHDAESKRRRRAAVTVARRLGTEAGWPVPTIDTFEDDEILFVRQEFMAGQTIERLTDRMVDDLLTMLEQASGLATTTDLASWPHDLLFTLTDGGQGYCDHEPLRHHNEATRRLVERVENIGHGLQPATLAGNDLIHWDLHPGNILARDGAVAAVVDLDFAKGGHAGFDLVTLWMTASTIDTERGVRSRLARAVDRLEPPIRLASTAHLLVRFLDWAIRKGRHHEVDFWLEQADGLLDP